jgi:hypothetical protein
MGFQKTPEENASDIIPPFFARSDKRVKIRVGDLRIF